MYEDRMRKGYMHISEIVDRYAYPAEPARLAALARQFPGVDDGLSDAECLSDALDNLIDGLLGAGHGDPEGSPEYWSENLSVALEANCYGDALVLAWREFAELPAPERRLVVAAAERWR